ncbi:TIGR02301 family protein [Tianweitania sp. BSSL-BM11]|uniref:TIGR02301 family protein n=1 Tax=Tianweitania aestuarii TaxID=2814886 RepID=A0ABS5RUN9_9HYPH|nr:TIGR02301 family protein [Tianweitania aestuarii]MBS9719954.1 TIGR02301 family protein [Tianweitania aestuarii]
MIRSTLPVLLLAATLGAASPVRAAEAPFEPSLLRLSEVLGSLHYLDTLCKQDGPQWRGLMEKLVAAEAQDEARKARFIASFNRGYRSFASVYTTCTASAKTALQRYRNEGQELASQTAARFGN